MWSKQISKFEHPDIEAIQKQVPTVYSAWGEEHADGTALTVRPYSAQDPYQKVENVRIEPNISFEQAIFLGKIGMGEEAYDRLSAGFIEHRAEALVMDRHKRGKNTLFATLHLTNVLDTALTHNNFFVTSGGKKEIADINDVLVNPMMAYLDIGGFPVYEALAFSGGIDEALPYRAAKAHGMSKQAREFIGRRASSSLEARLGTGVAIHWSMPGTRGKKVILADGSETLIVNRVETAIAEYVISRLGEVVPVPMNMHPGSAEVEVLTPRKIETVQDVHKVMEEMVEVISDLSDERFYYGLPPGARLAA
ncbi:MAG TPA: hypothetical protein VFK97_02660 [Candidatus Saccharimonadales bacterium]|nr:hypothetical protein [Candidatus Saccharimonadales bacterium]